MYTEQQIKTVDSKVGVPVEIFPMEYAHVVSQEIDRVISTHSELIDRVPTKPSESIEFIASFLASARSTEDVNWLVELIDKDHELAIEQSRILSDMTTTIKFNVHDSINPEEQTDHIRGINLFAKNIVNAIGSICEDRENSPLEETKRQTIIQLARTIAEAYVENSIILGLDIDYSRLNIQPLYKDIKNGQAQLEDRTTLGTYNSETRLVTVNLHFLQEIVSKLSRQIVFREESIIELNGTVAHELFHDYLRTKYPKISMLTASRRTYSHEQYVMAPEEIACRLYGATYAMHHQNRADRLLQKLWLEMKSNDFQMPEWVEGAFLFEDARYNIRNFQDFFKRVRVEMGIGLNFFLKV